MQRQGPGRVRFSQRLGEPRPGRDGDGLVVTGQGLVDQDLEDDRLGSHRREHGRPGHPGRGRDVLDRGGQVAPVAEQAVRGRKDEPRRIAAADAGAVGTPVDSGHSQHNTASLIN
jgi:hypothetical protein